MKVKFFFAFVVKTDFFLDSITYRLILKKIRNKTWGERKK